MGQNIKLQTLVHIFTNIDGFSISQSSVATQLRWGGKANNRVITYFFRRLYRREKKKWKSANICGRYGQKFAAYCILDHPVHVDLRISNDLRCHSDEDFFTRSSYSL